VAGVGAVVYARYSSQTLPRTQPWLAAGASAAVTGAVLGAVGFTLADHRLTPLPTHGRATVAVLLVITAGWVAREIGKLERRRLEAERVLELMLSARELEVRRLAKRVHSSTTQQLAAAQWRLSRGQADQAADAL